MVRRKKAKGGAHKLNSNTQELLCEGIRRGLTRKTDLCTLAGISTTALDTWLGWADDPTHQHHLPAKRLKHAMELERARSKLRLLERMETAGENDWRMWAQKLKWVDPDEYGDKQNVNLSGEVKTNALTDDQRIEQLARILDAARARAGGQPVDGAESVEVDGAAGSTEPGGDVA